MINSILIYLVGCVFSIIAALIYNKMMYSSLEKINKKYNYMTLPKISLYDDFFLIIFSWFSFLIIILLYILIQPIVLILTLLIKNLVDNKIYNKCKNFMKSTNLKEIIKIKIKSFNEWFVK